jgi:glutamate-1-semialdehyde aminotransferase
MSQSSHENTERGARTHGGVQSILPGAGRILRGRGGRCWDAETEYVDLVCGYGAVLLGHGDEAVTRAVADRLANGALFAAPSEIQVTLELELQKVFRAEACQLLKTGSDAVSTAARLARAFTGKSTIVRCGFHGWHDDFVRDCRSWHGFGDALPSSTATAGLSHGSDPDATVVWNGADLGQLEDLLRKKRSAVAALLLDPVQLRPPLGERLDAIRQLVHDHDALLILDEAKTAFRVHLGGVQGCYGVSADLTLAGKSLGNGLPICSVLGPKEILGLAGEARIMGTFNGELSAVAAALVTLSRMASRENVEQLEHRGAQFISGANAIFESHHLAERLEAVPYRWPCMPFLWFRDDTLLPWREAFHRELTHRGLLLLPNHMNFVCLAHTKGDIDDALVKLEQVVASFEARFRGR